MASLKMLKKRILFVIGGRSGEHEISLISAKHVLNALNRDKFDPLIVIIQKDGIMTLGDESSVKSLPDNPKNVKTPTGKPISIRPYGFRGEKPAIVCDNQSYAFDVAFPILHGPGGEDGTIQGMFELAEIPTVGCGVKASAICMDKGVTKKLCQVANLPVVPFIEVYRGESLKKSPWPYPVFVKPAHLGSSLGVSKVKNEADLSKALQEVFKIDTKALVEPAIVGREVEIAILGKRGHLLATEFGEVKVTKAEFYSYDAKYVEADAAEIILPTKLSKDELQRGQKVAKEIFEALECYGMARIDFFLTEKGEFLLNEVNTIPGFTPISIYPKLIQISGISYSDLITRLVELALP